MSHTPTGTANKIKPLSKAPSIQKRDNEVSIRSGDLARLGLYMSPVTVSKTESATMGGSLRGGQEATSRLQSYVAGQPHPKMRFPPPMKTGGLIKKTGVYTLHKGEVVVPKIRVKTVDIALKKDKKKPLKK